MILFGAACAGLAYFGLHKPSDSHHKEENKTQMDLFQNSESAKTKI
jgi:hypothetical protein